MAMRLQQIIVICILMMIAWLIEAKPTCKYNEFITEDMFGNKTCVKCPTCSEGFGLIPQCGSVINYGGHFRCEPCKAGVSYSTTNDIGSCRPCAICDGLQISECTPTNNSKCEEGCKQGFYYSEVTDDCQKCSWCCKGSSPIKDCGSGNPFYKQCSANEYNCQPKCSNQKFVYVDKSFNKSCEACPNCPVGKGLNPPCSSVITSRSEPKCEHCIPGYTFSDATDSSTCKKCSTCQVGKNIERACNATHDTLCGDCRRGFYNGGDKNNVNCLECSYCCGDRLDVIVPECKSQGLPGNLQCAYTERAVNKCRRLNTKYINIGLIVGLVVSISAVILLTCLAIYVRYNRNNTNSYKRIVEEGSIEVLSDQSEEYNFGPESASIKSTSEFICFHETGVQIICNDQKVGKEIMEKVSVVVCPLSAQEFPKLGNQQVILSPVIKFHSQDLLLPRNTTVSLELLHTAKYKEVDEKNKHWSMTVRRLSSEDESTSDWTDMGQLTNIVANEGFVRMRENKLGTYVVIGQSAGDGKDSKKRMNLGAFGDKEPKANASYTICLCLIDDCPSSLKKLENDENKEGRIKLYSLQPICLDINPNSFISLSIDNLSNGWGSECFPSEKLNSEQWLHSFEKIPKFEVKFKHEEEFEKDFKCTFILRLNDSPHVIQIPVTNYFKPYVNTQTYPPGIQEEDNGSSSNSSQGQTNIPMNVKQQTTFTKSQVMDNGSLLPESTTTATKPTDLKEDIPSSPQLSMSVSEDQANAQPWQEAMRWNTFIPEKDSTYENIGIQVVDGLQDGCHEGTNPAV